MFEYIRIIYHHHLPTEFLCQYLLVLDLFGIVFFNFFSLIFFHLVPSTQSGPSTINLAINFIFTIILILRIFFFSFSFNMNAMRFSFQSYQGFTYFCTGIFTLVKKVNNFQQKKIKFNV